jgi:hypothetical protein
MPTVVLPDDFSDHLAIANAAQRFEEASRVADQAAEAGVPLLRNLDHAAIFTDPPYLVSGPLKRLGYVTGWDTRCYPSPVDNHDYINVPARLGGEAPARRKGWFEYVAIVHPVDEAGREHMLSKGYGNPFVHHLTWGIVPPDRGDDDEFAYAAEVVPYMAQCRARIAEVVGEQPGTLICALPRGVLADSHFRSASAEWVAGLPSDQYQFEVMQGGGFLIQFFVLTGGRIEVALRVGTRQTFNPKSVHKISTDEISADQGAC